MKQKTIELILVLDESGSMDCIRDDTIKNINRLLDKQRAEGPTNVTIVKFSSCSSPLVCGEDIDNISILSREDYNPQGTTALYDGIGDAIETANKRNVVVDENTAVMFVIITDGYENASQRYNLLSIREILQSKEKEGWVISYLGANLDSHSEAAKIGATYSANWVAQSASVASVYDSISTVSTTLRCDNLSADSISNTVKAIYDSNLNHA